MDKSITILVSVLGLAFSMSACSNSSGPAAPKKIDSDAAQRPAISRTSTPSSVFTPTELETTVDNLVAEINKTSLANLQMNVILKQVSTYFQPVVIGANRAMGELQVAGNVASPSESDGDAATADQMTMVSDDLAQKTNGIGIAPFREEVKTSIDQAVAAGVPVITIDSDQADSQRDLYIGTLNGNAGTTAGNTLTALLPSGGGTVVILGQGTADWPDGYNRTMGAKTVIDAAGYTSTVITANWSDNSVSDLAAMANLFATASPPVVGMAGMFSNAWECAKAAETAGKTGADVAIVAFDFDPQTVTYMKSGLIKATHAQRQYYMGYLTPYVIYGMNVLGKDKTKSILSSQMIDQYQFNTGLDVIQSNQLDDYSAFLDSLGIGASN